MLFIKRRVCLCVRLCLYLWTYVYIVGMQGSTINKYYENKLWNRKNLMNESMKIKFKQKSRQQTFKFRRYQMTEWYKINEWMYVQYISFYLSFISFIHMKMRYERRLVFLIVCQSFVEKKNKENEFEKVEQLHHIIHIFIYLLRKIMLCIKIKCEREWDRERVVIILTLLHKL